MALTCPHVIWRISPFNTTNRCVTDSFQFLDSDWRWEYYVHTNDDNEIPDEIVSIYLKRLTDSPACSLSTFCTISSIRDSMGEYHALKILNHKLFPQVSWCVWKKSKLYILSHDVVENNSCTFSLTLEPLNHLEETNSLLTNKNRNISCLEGMSDDNEKFLEHSKHADIILKCGNTEINAHKDILSFRSAKFSDIIEQEDNLEKKSSEKLDKLILHFMDPPVFEILLRFIYTATLPDLTNELATKLYKIAEEYSIDSLKKRCMMFLIENLSNSNAIETLLFADKYNDLSFKWAVSSHIACDINILHSDEWKKFSKTNQKLALDVFDIFTERLNKGDSSDILALNF